MQLTFKILILYPNTLMNFCISSDHFLVGPLGFSVHKITSSRRSLRIECSFFLSNLDAYSLAYTSKESTNCFSLQLPLFFNTSLDNFFILCCKRSQFFDENLELCSTACFFSWAKSLRQRFATGVETMVCSSLSDLFALVAVC